MMLGSLVDLGAPRDLLMELPGQLGIADEVIIGIADVITGGVRACQVRVTVVKHSHSRHLTDILDRIQGAGISERARDWAQGAFTRLGTVEASMHGVDVSQVHFHEVGGQDALIDIVGTATLLDALNPHGVWVSGINLGGGMVKAAHGELPVPAPATLELLSGFTVYGSPVSHELTTPTGAALVATLAQSTVTFPRGVPARIGWGAGQHQLPWPNTLRAVWMEVDEVLAWSTHEAVLLESNIDDMTPELFGALGETLMGAGARDVWMTPIQMKKGRPAVKLSVLAAPESAESLARTVFLESTTLGLRAQVLQTWQLPRTIETVPTRYGPIGIKIGWLDSQVRSWAPEFDDCRKAALEHKVPIREVMEAAWDAGRDRFSGEGGHRDGTTGPV